MIRTTFKAAAVVLTLGVAALAAAPAQAYDFGDDENDFEEFCMTDYQIRNAIEDEGFYDIYLNVANSDGEIQVKATMDDVVYLIDYDTCAHQIDDIEEL